MTLIRGHNYEENHIVAYENLFVNFMCKLVLPCFLLCKRVVIKPLWVFFLIIIFYVLNEKE